MHCIGVYLCCVVDGVSSMGCNRLSGGRGLVSIVQTVAVVASLLHNQLELRDSKMFFAASYAV